MNTNLDTPRSAQENMALDEVAFQEAEITPNYFNLRFYSWLNPAISYGYSQDIAKLVDVKKAKTLGVELVRRLTGGGIVLHQPNELTYCLAADQQYFSNSIIASCNQISKIIITGLARVGVSATLAETFGINNFREKICFARPTKYEIIYANKKLVGSAQKRGKTGFMQHGSIQMDKRDPLFDQLLDCAVLNDRQISIGEILNKKINYIEIANVLNKQFEMNLRFKS